MAQISANAKPVKVLLHAIFFLAGIATVFIGPVLPVMINRFSLNDLEAGYIFPAQFAGSVIGTYLTTYFGRRGKFLPAVMIGCFLMATGMLLVNANGFAACLVGFGINGLGVGLTLPAINLIVLETAEGNSAAALSILNFCWGAGAIVCKPFIDQVGDPGSIAFPTLILAVLFTGLGVMLVIAPSQIMDAERRENGLEQADIKIWVMPLAWMIAAFNFIHVGFETAIGGWLTAYSDRTDPSRAADLFSPFVFYFGFLVLGRAIIPLFLRQLSENAVMISSLVVIFCGLLVTLSAASTTQLSVGAAIAGFGTSTVFPTSISRFGRIFGPGSSRHATPLFLAGTIGGAVVSWLIGFLSNQMASLRLAMYVLVVSVALLLVLQTGVMVTGRRSTEST